MSSLHMYIDPSQHGTKALNSRLRERTRCGDVKEKNVLDSSLWKRSVMTNLYERQLGCYYHFESLNDL